MRSKMLKLGSLMTLGLCFMFANISVQAQDSAVADSASIATFPKPLNLREITKSMPYPLAWQQNGIKGKVMVKMLVDEEGNITKHEIIKSAHKNLTTSVEGSLYHLKFTPAYDKNSKVVKAWTTLPFDFHPKY